MSTKDYSPDVLNPEETLELAKKLVKSEDKETRSLAFWYATYKREQDLILKKLYKVDKLINDCLP